MIIHWKLGPGRDRHIVDLAFQCLLVCKQWPGSLFRTARASGRVLVGATLCWGLQASRD